MGSILSPLFDHPGLVVVESGFNHIQSAQSGQYLSMPDMKYTSYLDTLPAICAGIAPTGMIPGVQNTVPGSIILASPLISMLLVDFFRNLLELSETKATRWEIQSDIQADGRFRLTHVRSDRDYLVPHDNHQLEMVAIKAGDNGEVYLKVLFDGKRSKWLHPKGKAKKYVGLRSSRQWKWKLIPDDDEDEIVFDSSSNDESISSDEDSSEYSSDEYDSESDSDDSSIESEFQDKSLFQEIKETLSGKYQGLVGTSDTRYSKRTHPAYEWKQKREIKRAKAAYLKQLEIEKKVAKERLENSIKKKVTADIRKEQKKRNKKQKKRLERDLERQKIDYDKEVLKFGILSNLRVQHVRLHEEEQSLLRQKREADRIQRENQQWDQEQQDKHTAEKNLRQEETEGWNRMNKVGIQYGLLPAIHTPPSKEAIVQNEHASSVVLQQTNGKFDIKLKRFKHCTALKGERIDVKGCVELAKTLGLGACGGLKSLNLGWNKLTPFGMESLSRVFSQGACAQLTILDLRMCRIGVKGLVSLMSCMRNGGLPDLEELNVQGNNIGDEGAKVVAHGVFNQTFQSIVRLSVRQNDIGNLGGKALWSAFNSEGKERLCPKLKVFDMSRNKIQQDQLRHFRPCPGFIQY